MIGQVDTFDETVAFKYIESLIDADEVERALLVLNNLPAFYRDNPPLKLANLKRDILSSIVTPHAYLSSGLDAEVKPEQGKYLLDTLLRGMLVQREVARYNRFGRMPHIVDMGPGEYFVPIGLQASHMRFSYWDLAVDQNTQKAAHPMLEEVRRNKPQEDQPLIFLALEIIEHLPAITDITVEALRHCGRWPDRVHLSTPCYTFDATKKNWRKPCGLPHLRAYTPKEFVQSAESLFPGYQFEVFPSQIMSIRGMREGKIDSDPILHPTELKAQ